MNMLKSHPAARLAALGLLALLAVLMPAEHVLGQFGRSSMRSLIEPDIMRRDVPYLAKQLDLDRSQRVLFETMIDQYERTVHNRRDDLQAKLMEHVPQVREQMRDRQSELRERAREEMQAIREEMSEMDIERGSPEAREMMRQRMMEMRADMTDVGSLLPDTPEFREFVDVIENSLETWQSEKRRLRDELLTDLELQLADHQLENWETVKRGLRRESALDASELSGEGVDLIRIVDSLELDEAEMQLIEDDLESYAIVLDEALRRRDQQIEQGRVELIDVLRTQDVDEAMQVIDQELRQREAVRKINHDYMELLASKLPDEAGQALRSAALEAGYDRIFSHTVGQRTFIEARDIEGLDEEIAEQIRTYEQQYRAELAEQNTRLVRLTRDFEAERIRDRIEGMARMTLAGRFRGPRGRDDDDNPMEEAFERRREIGQRYVSMLEEVLTEEQFASLPAAQARAERERRMERRRERVERMRNQRNRRDDDGNDPDRGE